VLFRSVNGTKGFILSVLKQEQADIIRTVERVKKRVNELKENYPNDLTIFFTQDRSISVENRLNIITNNAYIGLALVLVVLGLFLSVKTAFWVAVSLPVSLL
jgi:multidrug efflux pump subunit AcrB